MMLRKYLDGAILEDIEQIENDRVIHFHFAKRNELGDLQNIILIVELMGRHSTIVLVNRETGKYWMRSNTLEALKTLIVLCFLV